MPAGFVNAADYDADASGLNAAAAAAGSQGKDLWIPKPAGGVITIASTFTVPAGVSVEQFAMLSYTGPTSTPAVVWGSAGTPNPQRTWRGVHVTRDLTWVNNYDHVGFRLYNPQYCNVVINTANAFDVGVQIVGDGDDAVGTRIECHSIRNVRVAYHLMSRNGGRVTNNIVMGGRQTVFDAGPDPTYPRYHYVTDSEGTGGSTAEKDSFNILMGSNAEFDARDTSGDTAAFYLKTPFNFIWGLREEAYLAEHGKPVAIVDGPAAHHNTIWLRYDRPTFDGSNVSSRNGAPSNNFGVSPRDVDFPGKGGFSF